MTASDLMPATPSPSPITATATAAAGTVRSERVLCEVTPVEATSSPAATSEADSLDIIVHQATLPSFSLPAAAATTRSLCAPPLTDVPDSSQMRRPPSSRSSSSGSAAGVAASLLALDRPLCDARRASTGPAPTVVRCRFSVGCRNASCRFAHPSPAASAAVATQRGLPDVEEACFRGSACANPVCRFAHPSAASAPGQAGRRGEMPLCRNQENCPFGACLLIVKKFLELGANVYLGFHRCELRIPPSRSR